MKRHIAASVFLTVVMSQVAFAQQQCSIESPRMWATFETVCSALIGAWAQRIDMNIGQQARAQMLRARAQFLLRFAERHMLETGGDLELMATTHQKLLSAYVDDENRLRHAISQGAERCQRILQLDQSSGPITVQELYQTVCRSNWHE